MSISRPVPCFGLRERAAAAMIETLTANSGAGGTSFAGVVASGYVRGCATFLADRITPEAAYQILQREADALAKRIADARVTSGEPTWPKT